MDIFLGLIPALSWGFLPIVVSKIGGKPANQIIGTTAGAFIVAVVIFLTKRPETTFYVFGLSVLSGAMWGLGQIGQYRAYTKIGVSRTMPISSGLQLIGTSIIGVLVFKEWGNVIHRIIGFTALLLVVAGIAFTSYSGKGSKAGKVSKATLMLLFFTNFGYLAYSSIPAVLGTGGISIFLPQTMGMLMTALLYVVFSGNLSALKEKVSCKNIISGFLFAGGAIAYIFSAERNGIATGFVLAQLSVIVAIIASIAILKEYKTKIEIVATTAGLAMILAGAVITAFL